MKAMDGRALEYLKTQRVGVLAVEMLDGSPHAATVHFAHADDPAVFYFETNREYRKAEPILSKPEVRASFVVGTNEADMKTVQLDGLVSLLKPEEEAHFEAAYLGKFPEKAEKANAGKCIFFTFAPTWWRFTDWKTPDGKLILASH